MLKRRKEASDEGNRTAKKSEVSVIKDTTRRESNGARENVSGATRQAEKPDKRIRTNNKTQNHGKYLTSA